MKIRAGINEVDTKITIQRINESRSWLFEKIEMVSRSLVQVTKRKRWYKFTELLRVGKQYNKPQRSSNYYKGIFN